ncbi:MAG TPA: SAM-dependent methyltransferase, partial [Methanobacterium sp.]|nr:SAM-dependent methyltransferase [Methanobacterium sp.]
MKEKRIESKTSRTAEFTCMTRAASFYEKRPQYKNNDYIAPKLLPKFMVPIIKIGALRKFFTNRFPSGMYEYVIARTKFIDSVFQKAISNEFDQILIFGAGFDSRGIRFGDLNKKTIIFELDAPVTQKAKINQLKKRGIRINPNITFISIDFNKESLEDKLIESGFTKNKRSLFILEGLTMYLNPEAIENTFSVINQFAGNDSELIFDYVYSSVLREENLYYGESEVLKHVNDANEPWSFGIEKGEIESFLKDRNLKLIQNLNSEDLENKFFTDEHG